MCEEAHIYKLWYIYVREQYSVIKNNKLFGHVKICMDLKSIVLSDKLKTNFKRLHIV